MVDAKAVFPAVRTADHFVKASFFISAHEVLVAARIDQFPLAGFFVCHFVASSVIKCNVCEQISYVVVRERSTVFVGKDSAGSESQSQCRN